MELKDLSGHPLCSKYMVELGDTSLDTDNNQKLVNSALPAINFDSVVKEYANKLGIQIPSSADAFLYVGGDDEAWLIEFKNGHVGRDLHKSLAFKVYYSITVFSDLPGMTVERYIKDLLFGLVLNAPNH